MFVNLTCDVCGENETHDQIKAGCGHLIRICSDCRGEQKCVQHEPCGKKECGGVSRAHNSELRRQEEEIAREYENASMYDLLDDYDFRDDFPEPEPEPYIDTPYDY